MRELFPGYYPPSEDDMREFVTKGLVALDTNALLNIYRFTEQARNEYLDALRLLESRLWIPHHVGYEFFNNRAQVIRDCAAANNTLATALDGPFSDARAMIDLFANYRGLTEGATEAICQILHKATADILDKLNEIYDFPVAPETPPESDAILHEIEELLDGKIGSAFSEKDAIKATTEGNRRIKNNIPPGYADKRKGEDKAVGDYLIWAQLINEAKYRRLPILLVTNDEKEDWVHLASGQALGPRTELVLEMHEKAGQKFHIVTAQVFLVQAKMYMSAEISDATVSQAAPSRHPDDDEGDDVDTGSTSQATNPIGRTRSPLAAQLAAANRASQLAAQFATSNSIARLAAQFATSNSTASLAAQIAASNSTAGLAAQIAAVNRANQLAAQLARSSPTARLAAQIAKTSAANTDDECNEDNGNEAGDDDATPASHAEE